MGAVGVDGERSGEAATRDRWAGSCAARGQTVDIVQPALKQRRERAKDGVIAAMYDDLCIYTWELKPRLCLQRGGRQDPGGRISRSRA